MKALSKALVIGAVVVAVAAASFVKESRRAATAAQPLPQPLSLAVHEEEPIPPTYEPSVPGIPRLAALGAGACIPCKAMAPIRAQLRREYAEVLAMDFYDVWKDKNAGRHFGIYAIPTLIFYDASGRELTRKEGFVSKEEILATYRGFGIDLRPTSGG